jgi:AAA15 family ATPase/GTPase
MLIEFRLGNYRSFKDEAVLSMVASADKSLQSENTFEASASLRLTRSAVIYGANASGKSNLLSGLNYMAAVVLQSASLQPSQNYNIQPFRLNAKSKDAPSLFEVMLLLEGKRYQFGFELTSTRIVREWLLVYEKAKAQLWYERNSAGDKKDSFKFGPHLAGPKRVWQDATRLNALFLSTAAQLNSESLAPLYRWFAGSLKVFLDGGGVPFDVSTSMIASPEGHRRIADILSAADIAISSIASKPTKGFLQQFSVELASGKTSSQLEEAELLLPTFRHQSGDFSADFELGDESLGTQKLFSLAGPLFHVIENGHLLAIDELDRSLHPLLVRRIVEAFQNPKANCRGAQLIFTTHDTSLLDSSLLRRDQIWFTEKRADQSSTLVPLSEFSPRKGEALERNYLSGRYGGVPILANGLLAESGCVDA